MRSLFSTMHPIQAQNDVHPGEHHTNRLAEYFIATLLNYDIKETFNAVPA
jgi:hypothetical protein